MIVAKVVVVKCPLCGMSKRQKESGEAFTFDESELDDFIRVQEVGGSETTGRGIGRGKAKGKVETLESYSIDDVPDEYEHILEKLRNRLNELEV